MNDILFALYVHSGLVSLSQGLSMGTPVYLEADFEEGANFVGFETGFRECIVSTFADMSDNRVVLVR